MKTHRSVCEPCGYRPFRSGPNERRSHKQLWSGTKCGSSGAKGLPLRPVQSPGRNPGLTAQMGHLEESSVLSPRKQGPYRASCSGRRNVARLPVAPWAAAITKAHETEEQERRQTPLRYPQGQSQMTVSGASALRWGWLSHLCKPGQGQYETKHTYRHGQGCPFFH